VAILPGFSSLKLLEISNRFVDGFFLLRPHIESEYPASSVLSPVFILVKGMS
jgi:hypothetical protein